MVIEASAARLTPSMGGNSTTLSRNLRIKARIEGRKLPRLRAGCPEPSGRSSEQVLS
jgi:hypothetical protein